MNRLIVVAVVGLMIAAALPTSASALSCVARSPNGAMGAAQGVLLFPGRAKGDCAAEMYPQWRKPPRRFLDILLVGP